MPAPECQACSSFLNKKWGVDENGVKRPRASWCCPYCKDILKCFQCCQCQKVHHNWGGSDQRGRAAVSASTIRAQGNAVGLVNASSNASSNAVQANAAGLVMSHSSSSNAGAETRRSRSRSAEGRRYTRSKITKALIDQWRHLKIAERPMPSAGRADSGIIPGATWGEALRKGKSQTQELLRQDSSGYHSSVHLTLYLQWASEEIRKQGSRHVAGLEIGRHIQEFLR